MEKITINEMQSSEQQKPTALSHPWRRFFARGIDFFIYSIIWLCIQYFVLRWHPEDNSFITLLISYINYTLMIIIEPILLCTRGTTPGKAVFGLILRSKNGDKLTYIEALMRTFGVFSNGYGYGIPIYNLVRMYKCRKASLNGETMTWDYECDTDYHLIDLNVLRIVVYIATVIFLFAIAYIITLQSQMPLHRGNITPIQYAENINDILTRPNTHKGVYMDKNGYWKEESNTKDSITIDISYTQVSSLPNHQLTVEDGIVTGVSFILENDEKSSEEFIPSYIPSYTPSTQKYYMILAFLFAQKSTNCFTLNTLTDSELETIVESMDNFDIEFHGIRITQEIEYSGYIVTDKGFWAQKDETQEFKMIFSMELIQ